jgi:hypothetical protein
LEKTRSWQESFDRLAAERRAQARLNTLEAKQVRDAEFAYANAAAMAADKRAAPALMLVSTKPDPEELVAKPKRQAAKRVKALPRKRTATKRTAASGKVKVAKPRKLPRPPAVAQAPDAILTDELPTRPAEELLIAPLPRSASLTAYRKAGWLSQFGAWLIKAKIKTRPPELFDEVIRLRAENARLRRQLEALLAFQDSKTKVN